MYLRKTNGREFFESNGNKTNIFRISICCLFWRRENLLYKLNTVPTTVILEVKFKILCRIHLGRPSTNNWSETVIDKLRLYGIGPYLL